MPLTLSPNMNLPIPTVGAEPGPDYASDVNASLTLIDGHDHASGSGVQITPAGMNISSDLGFLNNNATTLRSVRFMPQSAVLGLPADLGCLYEVVDDLYYNDGVGNQIRITQSGGVAGTPGSIANLVPPASASYVSADSTFVWQSDANIAANMDAGAYIFRNLTANSFGVTVEAPNALAANYTLVLPLVPLSTKFVRIDAAGNMAADVEEDNSTLEVSTGTLQVKDQGITQTQILVRAAPGSTAGVGEVAFSSSSGSFTTSSASFVNVTNLSVVITTLGNPVQVSLISDGSGNSGFMGEALGSTASFRLLSNAGEVARVDVSSSGGISTQVPSTSFSHLLIIGAGTYTLTVQASNSAAQTTFCVNTRLVAYEIK